MRLDDRLLKVLRRRFELAEDGDDERDIVLEAVALDEWLHAEPLIREHVHAIEEDRTTALEGLRAKTEAVLTEARSLRDPVLAVAPRWADGPAYRHDVVDTWYTVEHFDQISGAIAPSRDVAHDATQGAGQPIDMMLQCLDEALKRGVPSEQIGRKDVATLRHRVTQLRRRLEHANRTFLQRRRISPANAFTELADLRRRVNAAPDDEIGQTHMRDENNRSRMERGNIDDDKKRRIRASLARIRVELEARIAAELSHRELVERFKRRAEWYDREHLLRLADGKERPLVLKLARFLFDHGVDVLVEPSIGGIEPDVLDLGRALVLEGKVTRGSSGRSAILKGILETFSYAARVRAKGVATTEAHFVVFRLAGPTYALPARVPIGELTIHLTSIDLAPAKQSGSRQAAIITICADEVATFVEGARPLKAARRRRR